MQSQRLQDAVATGPRPAAAARAAAGRRWRRLTMRRRRARARLGQRLGVGRQRRQATRSRPSRAAQHAASPEARASGHRPDASAHHDARAEGRERGTRSAADGRRLGQTSKQGRDVQQAIRLREMELTAERLRSVDRGQGGRAGPRSVDRCRVSATTRCRAHARDRADRADARLRHAEAALHEPVGQERGVQAQRQSRSAPGGPAVQGARAGAGPSTPVQPQSQPGCTRWVALAGRRWASA